MTSLTWESPAFKAGLYVGTEIEAVNAEAYSADSIKAAILAAKGTKVPIRLTVKNYDRFRDILLDYHDGPRYPRLQKVGTGDGGLDKLLTPR